LVNAGIDFAPVWIVSRHPTCSKSAKALGLDVPPTLLALIE
jgi:hypothetical protein